MKMKSRLIIHLEIETPLADYAELKPFSEWLLNWVVERVSNILEGVFVKKGFEGHYANIRYEMECQPITAHPKPAVHIIGSTDSNEHVKRVMERIRADIRTHPTPRAVTGYPFSRN